jgi:hypothetical protein
LQHDSAGMAQQATWSIGKPGQEALLLYFEANTAAYSGQLNKSREFSRQAVRSAERAGEKDRARAPKQLRPCTKRFSEMQRKPDSAPGLRQPNLSGKMVSLPLPWRWHWPATLPGLRG